MDVQQSNPFQPPQADLQQATTNQSPLYSVAGVGLVTFIGTPLAGAWLLAHNLQLLGKADRVAMVWVFPSSCWWLPWSWLSSCRRRCPPCRSPSHN